MSNPLTPWQVLELQVQAKRRFNSQMVWLTNALVATTLLLVFSLFWHLRDSAGYQPSTQVLLPTSVHGYSGVYLLVATLLFIVGQWLFYRKPLMSQLVLIGAGLNVVLFIKSQGSNLSDVAGVDFILWHYGVMELLLMVGLLAWTAVLQSFWQQRLSDGYHRMALLQRYFLAMLMLWLLVGLMVNLPLGYYQ
ncbi:hypothetical protein [Ferrimonas lipolytica]|uniref:Uncharacterized protein n=1 Tax=Ferrimonas lipolytica TaxID=2724191 RepID=A0A6H1UCY8_9GAMM|nr:hypothetical protein [Ferrimonas lipolytica]QIZ76708.1 hypothetical protein HER31_07380 [Ferrimonas lipolytica]